MESRLPRFEFHTGRIGRVEAAAPWMKLSLIPRRAPNPVLLQLRARLNQCILDIQDQIGKPIVIPTANAAIR
jgi:hypothetical protein